MYNTSLGGPSAAGCAGGGGLACLVEQAIGQLARAMEQVLMQELNTFQEVSIEEWEIIMPSQQVYVPTLYAMYTVVPCTYTVIYLL